MFLLENVCCEALGLGLIRVLAQDAGERGAADGGQLALGELACTTREPGTTIERELNTMEGQTQRTGVGVEEPVRLPEHLELYAHEAVERGPEDGADDGLLHVAGHVHVDVVHALVGVDQAVDQIGRDKVGHLVPRAGLAEPAKLPLEMQKRGKTKLNKLKTNPRT